MHLRQLECENCGAPLEWGGKYGQSVRCPYCGSVFLPGASAMEDVWLMTDPVARARYEHAGKLDQLEHDIRFEVMRGQDWSGMDRAFSQEISRLEANGIVRKLATFWAVSPHPPVYRALQNGEINLGEQQIAFSQGQEIVWACPMTRDRYSLDFPVLIGDFQDERVQRLCGEMASAMQGRMG